MIQTHTLKFSEIKSVSEIMDVQTQHSKHNKAVFLKNKMPCTWITKDNIFVFAQIPQGHINNAPSDFIWGWQTAPGVPENIKKAVRSLKKSFVPATFSTRTEGVEVLYSVLQGVIKAEGIVPDKSFCKYNKTRYHFVGTPLKVSGFAGNWKIAAENNGAGKLFKENLPELQNTNFATVKNVVENILQTVEGKTFWFEDSDFSDPFNNWVPTFAFKANGQDFYSPQWYAWLLKDPVISEDPYAFLDEVQLV